jgi:hypothetical protein
MLRAFPLLLASAFAVEDFFASSPTDDPDEAEEVLIDEYATDSTAGQAYRILQGNTTLTNTTPPPTIYEEDGDVVHYEVPWVPLAGVAAVAAAGGAYFLTRPAYVTETYDIEYSMDEEGLMNEYEYDEEYGEEEEYYEEEEEEEYE